MTGSEAAHLSGEADTPAPDPRRRKSADRRRSSARCGSGRQRYGLARG